METKKMKGKMPVSPACANETQTATNLSANRDNLGYAINLAREVVCNPTFMLTELTSITDTHNPQDYSALAAHRFRYGGSAALTVNVSRRVERSLGALSETDRARLHNYVKTGLRVEYIDAISSALTERRSR